MKAKGKELTYVAHIPGKDYVKIGVTDCPFIRMRTYWNLAYDAKMLHLFDGNHESYFKKNFDDIRIRVDGFSLNGRLYEPTEQYMYTPELEQAWLSFPKASDELFYGYKKESDKDLIEFYQSHTITETSNKFGISGVQIHVILYRNGEHIRKKGELNQHNARDHKADIIKMRVEQKKTLSAIASRYKCDIGTIKSILNENGISTRRLSSGRLNVKRTLQNKDQLKLF